MTKSIGFPNLGIELSNVGKSFDVFGFEIAYYGVIIGLGILAGILIATLIAKKTGQDTEVYYDLALWAVVLSIIGARLYYVAFSWDSYKDDLLSILNLRQGGLAIYGGVITAVIVTFIFAKVKKISFGLIADTAIVGLVLGQAIGRWGNFFNREAFGEYTNNFLAMRLPLDAVRASDVTELMRENMEVIEGLSYIQVHPTFLYESLWNTALVILLVLYTKHKKFNGEIILLYMLGYGVGRAWIEGLRTDQLLIPGTEIAVSQVLAIVLATLATVLLIWKHIKVKKDRVSLEEME